MENKSYRMPAIVWLKVTDYMHGWLQYELGGGAMVKDQKVVCVFDLPGARDILRMETEEDMMDKRPAGTALSDRRKNCIMAGLVLDEKVMLRDYGVTPEAMKTYVPIECPKMCLTRNGVLRPWTLDTCFRRDQAAAMQRLIRQAFWDAVAAFDKRYAERMQGDRYPAVDMIEAFCQETGTSDVFVDAMRREWQRRQKRATT